VDFFLTQKPADAHRDIFLLQLEFSSKIFGATLYSSRRMKSEESGRLKKGLVLPTARLSAEKQKISVTFSPIAHMAQKKRNETGMILTFARKR
jgi:hypothetical protein